MDKPMGVGRKVIAGVVAGALALCTASGAWAQAKPGPTGKPAAATKQGADAPAAGKPDLAAAKKHYSDGDKKYKAGDYAGALAEFKACNEIKPTPQVERYLGLTEDNLGHPAAASEWYDKFLAHVPDKLAEQGDEIKKRNLEIKALPGKVHIETTPAGANVSIDDKPQASPTPLDVDLAPGTHKVSLAAKGHLPTSKPIDVTFASTQTVSTTLDPEPPPPPVAPPPVAAAPPPPPPAPPPPPPEPRSKVPAFVTGGLAIVAAGVGTAFGVMALGDKSDYDKNPTSQKADDGDTHSLIADMAFGVAITFGVTSAVLFLTHDEPPSATASASKATTAKAEESGKSAIRITPTPIVGPHSGGAGFLLQF